jgi:hypothetical protein
MTEAITSRSTRGAGTTMPAAGTVDRLAGIELQRRSADGQAANSSTRYEIGNDFNPPTKLARSHSGFPLKSMS